MIDNDGFIDISSNPATTSTEIRENIQNKNLLQNKYDIYSNEEDGYTPIGKEGRILGAPTIYGLASYLQNSGTISFRARTSSASPTIFSDNFMKGETSTVPYSVNFLANGYNKIVNFQFAMTINNTEIMFAPVSFLKEEPSFRSTSNYFRINLTSGSNDEEHPYSPTEKYYEYKNGFMTLITDCTESNYNSGEIFRKYGYLYIKKYYSVLGTYLNNNTPVILRMDVDEDGIYGVYYYDTSVYGWKNFISWTKIKYIRIK